MENMLSQPNRTFQGQLQNQSISPMMMGMRPGNGQMINPFNVLPEQEEKKR